MNPHDVWFTADTHFGHEQILRHDAGNWLGLHSFDSIEAHDNHIIDQWNKVVRPNDVVYHLGDFAFRCVVPVYTYRRRLNGRIVLVPGNHDPGFALGGKLGLWQSNDAPEFDNDVVHSSSIVDVKVLGQKIVLCHYPLLRWSGGEKGAWHLHGHTHGNVKGPEGSLDVGINVWGRPISYGEVAWHMRDFRSLPHHPHAEYAPGEQEAE